MPRECPICGYAFDRNLPGISNAERPYFTHAREGAGTRYICSSVCMDRYIETVDHTQPGNPAEVTY